MSEEQGLTPYETREILFYKTENGEVRVEILLFQENLWLTQAKMAELFEVQKAAISKHLKNIFESGELSEDSVVSKMETTAADGKRSRNSSADRCFRRCHGPLEWPEHPCGRYRPSCHPPAAPSRVRPRSRRRS